MQEPDKIDLYLSSPAGRALLAKARAAQAFWAAARDEGERNLQAFLAYCARHEWETRKKRRMMETEVINK